LIPTDRPREPLHAAHRGEGMTGSHPSPAPHRETGTEDAHDHLATQAESRTSNFDLPALNSMRQPAPPSRPYGRYAVGLRPSLDPDAYFDAPSQVQGSSQNQPNNTEVGLDRPPSFRNDLHLSCGAAGNRTRDQRRQIALTCGFSMGEPGWLQKNTGSYGECVGGNNSRTGTGDVLLAEWPVVPVAIPDASGNGSSGQLTIDRGRRPQLPIERLGRCRALCSCEYFEPELVPHGWRAENFAAGASSHERMLADPSSLCGKEDCSDDEHALPAATCLSPGSTTTLPIGM
jgi:hypothetical protein